MQDKNIVISDLETVRSAGNYRMWTFDNIRQHIGQRVLEVGGGIGNLTEQLEKEVH